MNSTSGLHPGNEHDWESCFLHPKNLQCVLKTGNYRIDFKDLKKVFFLTYIYIFLTLKVIVDGFDTVRYYC